VFLTNTNGNARADILNLMRAATTLHPSVIRPGVEIDGRFSHRLGALAAANGIAPGKVHDAEADVDAMLGLCRLVREGAPELWSTFLRFSSKASVVDFVRDEDAFAYFDFFGSPRIMHVLTRVGTSPNDANAHYCLDLSCDIDALRKLDDAALAEALKAKRIAGAGLDVFEGEPKLNPDYAKLTNVVLTPHIGSASRATRMTMCRTAAANMTAVLEGRNPPNPVN